MDKYVSVPEKTLADFKDKNLNSIPEQKPLNLELMGRTKRELVQIDNEILSLEDRKFYLDGQLAQLKPDVQVISSRGERILSPEDRLKSLKMEYLAIMLSRYSKSLSIKYSEIHPDIVNLKNQILASDEELKKVQTARAIRDIGTRQPENPAYITLQARRDVAIQDLRALRQHREEIKGKLTEYENRLLQTPRVGRQYLELVRDYDNATAHYRELRAKAMKAEVAEQLEKSRKGERFSVIEPPVLPKNRSSRTGRPLLFLVRCWPSREDSVTCC